jgi:hypothetical protein
MLTWITTASVLETDEPAFAYNVTMFPSTAVQGNWLALAASGTGQILYAAAPVYGYSYLVLYVSKDYGSSWKATPLQAAWDNSEVSLTVDSTCCNILGGTTISSFGSSDCGETWYYEGLGFATVILDSTGQFGFGLVGYKNYYLSSNFGYRWSAVCPFSTSLTLEVASITMSKNATNLAAVGCVSVLVSGSYTDYVNVSTAENFTAEWKTHKIDVNASGCYSTSISSDSTGITLYLASGQYMYKSTDFGNTWPRLATPPPFGLYWIAISCDTLCKRIIVTGRDYNPHTGVTGSAIQYISNNFGIAWEHLNYSNTNTSKHIYSYSTVISESGDFVASIPLLSYYTVSGNVLASDNDGSIFLNCNDYMNQSTVILSSSTTVHYTFISIGYVCNTFYINPTLSIVSIDDLDIGQELWLNISLGNNGNEYDGMNIFYGSCGYAGANSSRRCTENIELNNTVINPSSGGSLSLVSVLTFGEGYGGYVSPTGNTSGFALQLGYLLTALPVLAVANDSFSHVKYDPLTLLSVFFMTTLLTLGGSLVGCIRHRLYKESIAVSMGRFGLFGFLVSMEIWFFCVMHVNLSAQTEYFVFLADLFIALRLVAVAPGVLILTMSLAPAFISGISFYQELLDSNGDDKRSSLVMGIVSLGVLFDPQLVVYFPWKCRSAGNDATSTADSTDRVHLEAGERYCGEYPDITTKEICTMFCGLTATTNVVSQIVCYAASFGNAGAAVAWTMNTLLLHILLVLYGVGYVISNVPTFATLYCELVASLKRGELDRIMLEGCGKYGTSYDWTIRKARIEKKWAAGNLFPFRLIYSFLVMLLTSTLCFQTRQRSRDFGYYDAPCRGTICWAVSFLAALILAFAVFCIDIFVILEYDEEYDPHLEMLVIASAFTLDAEKISRLLNFTVVAQSSFELFIEFILIGHVFIEYFYGQPVPLIVEVILCLMFTFPIIVWTKRHFRFSYDGFLEAAKAFIRLDITMAMYFFLKIMVAAISPLSLLANISVLKSQRGWFKSAKSTAIAEAKNTVQSEPTSLQDSKLLSFQLRDNWNTADGRKASDGVDDLSGSCSVSVAGCWFDTVARLSKRFTVVYSFSKLFGTILFTLYANTDYLTCGDPSRTYSTVTCDLTYDWNPIYDSSVVTSQSCSTSCIGTKYRPTTSYPSDSSPYAPPLPPTPWTCTGHVPNACICNNWFIFQFSIIVLHVLHFIVQSYFYMRYNYFDPQQNQINCVETYTFAGQNLTLFLTQPSMCLLSAIEAACIVIVWFGLIAAPGVYCSYASNYDSFDLDFAIFITVIEVYKANLSTCGKLFKRREFWWALWSLVRIDLFVFYGSTLFLQAFFFPFSVAGCLSSRSKNQAVSTTVYNETFKSPFSSSGAECGSPEIELQSTGVVSTETRSSSVGADNI